MTTPVNEHSTQQNRSRCVSPTTKQIRFIRIRNDRISPPAGLARNFFSITISSISARFRRNDAITSDLRSAWRFHRYTIGRYIDSGAIRSSVKPPRLSRFHFRTCGLVRSPHVPPLYFCHSLSFSFSPKSADSKEGPRSRSERSDHRYNRAVFFVARGKLNFHVATLFWHGVPRYSS